ncbi:MAG TPA: cupin-like domain-containing protein [Vicinamibacterales bacterium]|nr:cupin-like domain-containing protein [Vicinamibacterales bacterium]
MVHGVNSTNLLAESRDIRRLVSPSRELFEREHVKRHLPCIIEGLSAEWPSRRLWDVEYLRREIGDIEVPVTRTQGARSVFSDDARQVIRMRVSDFLDLDHSPSAPYKHLMMQRNMDEIFPSLRKDISLPPLFDPRHLFQTNFWYAPGTNVTLLHCDFASNLLTMIKGRKRLILFPPNAPVYPHPVKGNFAQVRIEEPDLTKFPRFTRKGSIDLTLAEGETLYIPGLWWHQVYSEPSMAVNFWWWPRGIALAKTVCSRQMIGFSLKRARQKIAQTLRGGGPEKGSY